MFSSQENGTGLCSGCWAWILPSLALPVSLCQTTPFPLLRLFPLPKTFFCHTLLKSYSSSQVWFKCHLLHEAYSDLYFHVGIILPHLSKPTALCVNLDWSPYPIYFMYLCLCLEPAINSGWGCILVMFVSPGPRPGPGI